MREDDAHHRQHERDRELRGDRVDAPGRKRNPAYVELVARERQGDEADHVEREDEEEERGHVGEPGADRLGWQPLLGDLGLCQLVKGLADRLAPARQ